MLVDRFAMTYSYSLYVRHQTDEFAGHRVHMDGPHIWSESLHGRALQYLQATIYTGADSRTGIRYWLRFLLPEQTRRHL